MWQPQRVCIIFFLSLFYFSRYSLTAEQRAETAEKRNRSSKSENGRPLKSKILKKFNEQKFKQGEKQRRARKARKTGFKSDEKFEKETESAQNGPIRRWLLQ